MDNFKKGLSITLFTLALTGCGLGGGGGGGESTQKPDNDIEKPENPQLPNELITLDNEITTQITPEMYGIQRSVQAIENWGIYGKNNPDWKDGYYTGDTLSSDTDNDGVILKFDNCPVTFNPEQFDLDEDGRGDLCDDDTDGDNFSDKYEENYESNPNDKEVIPQVFVPYENDYSEWERTGEIADEGIWAPALDKQETEFVQKRNNQEEKVRTVFIREKDKHSDTIRIVSEEEETQFFPFVEERTLIPRESNRSQRTERCGNWTPDPLTIPKGTTFNQERECYSIFDVTLEFFTNAEGGEVIIGEVSVIRETGPFIKTTTNIGQKEKYEPVEDEFTPWIETENFRSSESWLPSASGKTTSFTQFQNGEVEEERFKIVREKEVYTGVIREVSREKQTRWVDKQISRNVEALPGTWTSSGESCEGWTPSASEYNIGETFTQTNNCTINERRTVEFWTNGEKIGQETERRTGEQTTKTRTTEGTKHPYRWLSPNNARTVGTSCDSGNPQSCFNSIVASDFSELIHSNDVQSGIIGSRSVYFGGGCLNSGEKGWVYSFPSSNYVNFSAVMCNGGNWTFEEEPQIPPEDVGGLSVQSSRIMATSSSELVEENGHFIDIQNGFLFNDNPPAKSEINDELIKSLVKTTYQFVENIQNIENYTIPVNSYRNEEQKEMTYDFSIDKINYNKEKDAIISEQCLFNSNSIYGQSIYKTRQGVNDLLYNEEVKMFLPDDVFITNYDECLNQKGSVEVTMNSGIARFPSVNGLGFKPYDVTNEEINNIPEEFRGSLLGSTTYEKSFNRYYENDVGVNGVFEYSYDRNLNNTFIQSKDAVTFESENFKVFVEDLKTTFELSGLSEISVEHKGILKDNIHDFYYGISAQTDNNQHSSMILVGEETIEYMVRDTVSTEENGCEVTKDIVQVKTSVNDQEYNFEIIKDKTCHF